MATGKILLDQPYDSEEITLYPAVAEVRTFPSFTMPPNKLNVEIKILGSILTEIKWKWEAPNTGYICVYDVWYEEATGKLCVDIEVGNWGTPPYGVYGAYIIISYDGRGTLLGGVGLGRNLFTTTNYYKGYPLEILAILHEWGTLLSVIRIEANEIRIVT